MIAVPLGGMGKYIAVQCQPRSDHLPSAHTCRYEESNKDKKEKEKKKHVGQFAPLLAIHHGNDCCVEWENTLLFSVNQGAITFPLHMRAGKKMKIKKKIKKTKRKIKKENKREWDNLRRFLRYITRLIAVPLGGMGNI